MFANYLKGKKTVKDIINVNKAEMYEKLFKDDSSKTNFLKKKYYRMVGTGCIFLKTILLIK